MQALPVRVVFDLRCRPFRPQRKIRRLRQTTTAGQSFRCDGMTHSVPRQAEPGSDRNADRAPGTDLATNPLLRFITAIHSGLQIDKLGAGYVAAIPSLVAANCYGLYLSDAKSGRFRRVAVHGGVQRFVTRYEELGYACDPLFRCMIETRRPVHEGMLFTDAQWQRQPLRQTLKMRRLAHMLQAPLVAEGATVGALYFTRSPEDGPFSQEDISNLDLIVQHASIALSNALRYSEAEQRYQVMQGALGLVESPLILTDGQAEIRYSNLAADELLRMPAVQDALKNGDFCGVLRENIASLRGRTKRTASVASRLPKTNPAALRSLVVRTVELSSVPGIFASFLYQDARPAKGFNHLSTVLSPRELEVLEFLSRGLQNKEIARRLWVSPNTVKYHLKQMYQTLQVNSRSELLSKAYWMNTDVGGSPEVDAGL